MKLKFENGQVIPKNRLLIQRLLHNLIRMGQRDGPIPLWRKGQSETACVASMFHVLVQRKPQGRLKDAARVTLIRPISGRKSASRKLAETLADLPRKGVWWMG